MGAVIKMASDITFGGWEAIALIINAICARIFLNFPREMAEDAGTAGWLEVIYFSILAFGLVYLIASLYARFNRKDLLDIAGLAGGEAGRIITGLLILAPILGFGALILREYTENMKIISLTDSPLGFVMMFFMVAMVAACFLGLEAIVRFSAVAVPILTAGFLFIVLMVAPYYDFTHLLPVLGSGLGSVFGKGFFKVSTYSPLIYLFLIPPFLKDQKSFRRIGLTALGVSALLLLVSSLTYSLVYSYPTSLESFLPVFQLARLINYGRFFQRLESVFVISFAISAMLYLGVILFFVVHVFKKTFKLEYHRPLILPFAVILFSLALLPSNLMTAIDLQTKTYATFTWVIAFILPIVCLLLARLRPAPPPLRAHSGGSASTGGDLPERPPGGDSAPYRRRRSKGGGGQ
jgi:spore germination protein (amino acid permease)